MHYFLISVISALYIIKQPISSKGLHPPHPYSGSIFWLNTSLYLLKYALYLRFWCCNNKKPYSFWGAVPPVPLLQRYTSVFRPPLRKSRIHPCRCHHIFKLHDTLQDNTTHSYHFILPPVNTTLYQQSYFPKTIKDRNTLPPCNHHRKFLIHI